MASERPISDLAGLLSDGAVESIGAERSQRYDEYAKHLAGKYET